MGIRDALNVEAVSHNLDYRMAILEQEVSNIQRQLLGETLRWFIQQWPSLMR
jgi:hypothetical protein